MIQIMGFKKCRNTQKAIRLFKEHGINFQFRDLSVKPLAEGELNNITQKLDPDDLINDESSLYEQKGLLYMEYDAEEEILADNRILNTPLVRNESLTAIGYDPQTWQEWVKK